MCVQVRLLPVQYPQTPAHRPNGRSFRPHPLRPGDFTRSAGTRRPPSLGGVVRSGRPVTDRSIRRGDACTARTPGAPAPAWSGRIGTGRETHVGPRQQPHHGVAGGEGPGRTRPAGGARPILDPANRPGPERTRKAEERVLAGPDRSGHRSAEPPPCRRGPDPFCRGSQTWGATGPRAGQARQSSLPFRRPGGSRSSRSRGPWNARVDSRRRPRCPVRPGHLPSRTPSLHVERSASRHPTTPTAPRYAIRGRCGRLRSGGPYH